MQQAFSENPIYAAMAIVGTLVYVIKLIMLMFAGDMDTADIDEVGHVDGGAAFSIVSLQSILAFFMGCGWMGLAALREWEMAQLPALGVAAIFGFIMMFLSAFLTFKIKKLNSDSKVDLKNAVGKTGRSYTKIPAKGNGAGQVEITVNGKQQILQAFSFDEEIGSFQPVKVEQVDDSGHLIVKKS